MTTAQIWRSEEQAVFALRGLYQCYGYTPYKMSRFEEYDLYVRNKDFLISDRIITFSGEGGKLMALKPDVTLSIVKNAPEASGVVQKVYYSENVYRDYREIMQAGLECVGDLTDFSVSNDLGYYSGVVFRGYLPGITASVLAGGQYDKLPLEEEFTLNYRKYCGKNKRIVIANPNAPTGMTVPLHQIEQILRTNPDSLVVVDEAYVDFGGKSALPLIGKYENLLVVRTFSKSRCLAGGRLGYAFACPEVIADLEKIKYSTNPYNIDRLTLLLGEATVEAEDYYKARCRNIMETREWTAAQLKTLGFRVLPSKANFLFARTDKMDGLELYKKLRKL